LYCVNCAPARNMGDNSTSIVLGKYQFDSVKRDVSLALMHKLNAIKIAPSFHSSFILFHAAELLNRSENYYNSTKWVGLVGKSCYAAHWKIIHTKANGTEGKIRRRGTGCGCHLNEKRWTLSVGSARILRTDATSCITSHFTIFVIFENIRSDIATLLKYFEGFGLKTICHVLTTCLKIST
jgi:hypothetical protein